MMLKSTVHTFWTAVKVKVHLRQWRSSSVVCVFACHRSFGQRVAAVKREAIAIVASALMCLRG